jgi:hypothetical protein
MSAATGRGDNPGAGIQPSRRRAMFRQAIRCCSLGLLLALGACTTAPTIESNYDHSANFAAYRTFGYFTPLGTDKAGYATLVTQTLKDATRREMEARGYTYSEDNPDLLLNFNAKLAKQVEVSQIPVGPPAMSYYGYRSGFYGGWGGYYTDVNQYTEGTLNIDLVDAKRRQLVWEGVAVGRVTEKHRENREAAINTAVTEIFKKFPFSAPH